MRTFEWLQNVWGVRRHRLQQNQSKCHNSSNNVSSGSFPTNEPSCELWDLVMDMDWDRVIEHSQQRPEDASYMDGHYHESVLYLACQHNPPLDVIRAIRTAYPEAVQQVSRAHHDLPLHIAARYQLGADILQELLADYPVTALEQTRFGRTPLVALWEARMKQKQQQEQQQRLDQQRQAHSAIIEAGLQPHEGGAVNSGATNHHQISLNDDVEEEFWSKVLVLLKAVARFRQYPQYYLQTPSTRTKEFRNPTFCKSLNHRSQRTRILQGYLEANQRQTLLLVHAAVSLGALSCPLPVLKYVLQHYPEQVRIRDQWGQLPLHIAVGPAVFSNATRRKYRPREREFVVALLKAYPQAAKMCLCDVSKESIQKRDPELYRYPLFTALSNRHQWNDGIEDLFLAAPQVLSLRDPVTFLYPFLLAAVPSDESISVDLTTIFELIRAQPQVVSLLDLPGSTHPNYAELNRLQAHSDRTVGRSVASTEKVLLGTATAAFIGLLAGTL